MKKEIFDAYAIAIAKQFHLTMDQMFDKTKKKGNSRCKTNALLYVYGTPYKNIIHTKIYGRAWA